MRRRILKSLGWLLALVLLLTLTCTLVFFAKTKNEIQPLIENSAALQKPHLERLIICLDGVSWSLVRELQSQGYFKIFKPASKVVVTFPAMTNVSLADIWHSGSSRGYESLFFDRAANEMAGGPFTYVGGRRTTGHDYHSRLDYEEPREYEFLVYVAPLRIISADLRRAILGVYQSDKRVLRYYIKSSDGMIHLRGIQGAMTFAKNLDDFLTRIYQANGSRTEIIMFSDHGNEFGPSRRVPLDTALEAEGFTVRHHLAGSRGVVLPAFGLVSFAAVYASDEEKPEIAEILARQRGVDFVMYQRDGIISILERGGEAELSWRDEGTAFRYQPRGADPLQLGEVLLQLEETGKIDSGGYGLAEDWLTATADSEYPDAPYRIWKGLNGQVEYPADLLVSFKAGYFFGSRTFNRFFKLEATHGSLRPDSSEAFLMSTHRDYPPILRGEDIIQYLREREQTRVAGEPEESRH